MYLLKDVGKFTWEVTLRSGKKIIGVRNKLFCGNGMNSSKPESLHL